MSHVPRVAQITALAALYVLAGKLGLSLAFLHASASPVWPPTGIALAALLVLGRGVWPAVFVGAFVINLTTAGTVATSLGIAVGNTLEALLGAVLVERFAGGRTFFDRTRDTLAFMALAALPGPGVSATVGVTTLTLAGFARWDDYGSIWMTWWLGDAAGAVLIAPLFVLWSDRRGLAVLRRRAAEAIGAVTAVIAVGLVVFGGIVPSAMQRAPIAFLCIPPLLWAPLRFGPRMASTAVVALCAIAVAGTLRGHGPFAVAGANAALLLLQAFMATMAVTMLSVAALVWERKCADDERARLLDQERAARLRAEAAEQRVAVLGEIARSISATLDLDTVLRRIVEGASRLCRSGSAAIFLRDPGSDTMTARTRVGPWREGDETGMVVPILIKAEPAGLLQVSAAAAGGFSDEDEAVCVTLAEQAALAIQNARLFAQQASGRVEAEAENRGKDAFLAMLSHELRNPLGALTSAAHVLGLATVTAEQRERARQVIVRQLRHLGRLVDDLLDVSRVVAGKIDLHRQPLDLAEVVRHAVASLRRGDQLAGHRLSVDGEPAVVDADAVRLEQVITNLLANAAKYTPSGGEIEVTVRRSQDTAVLCIRDSGIGIPAELVPRVFDLFVQGDHTLDRAQGGLGVGLTLVRQLVELHGGSVEAVSDGPGRGSRFTVRLPAVEARGGGAADERVGPAASRRVLVVEDGNDAREMLCTLVRLLGHEAHEAAGAEAGVEAALRLTPDVTLVDIGLPGIDGYEVARAIRAHPAGKVLCLVALTGYGQATDRDRALAAGFDLHVVKPVAADVLRALLDQPRRPISR